MIRAKVAAEAKRIAEECPPPEGGRGCGVAASGSGLRVVFGVERLWHHDAFMVML